MGNIDHNEEQFIICHHFKSPIKKVFEHWINADLFCKWLGPDQSQMRFLKSEVKEGKTSTWEMITNDGNTKYGKIHYQSIQPYHFIAYSQHFCDVEGNFIRAPFSDTYPKKLLTTVEFSMKSDNDTKIKLVWEILGDASEVEIETFHSMKEMMRVGWNASFKKLELLLS